MSGSRPSAIATEYTWDAENRLIGVAPASEAPPDGALKLENTYDYQGRRIEKKVWAYDESGEDWDLTVHRKFLYDGWRIVLELAGLDSDATVRECVWGLDLAGQGGSVNSRGGAGGLSGRHKLIKRIAGLMNF